MPNNPEFSSFNSVEESFNNSPWAEESDMNVRSETEIDSTESEKTEANLADRIRNEMTLQEIEKLDIQKISDEEFAAVEERIKQFDETGNAGPITETELRPKVQELKKKAVNNIAFKSALDNLVKDIKEIAKSPKRIIAALGLTAMIAAAGLGGFKVGKEFLSNGADSGIENEQNEDEETEIGIKDGYGEEGLYLSENKAGPYNFSCGEEVEKVCNGDHHKELEYVAENQVESLADYIANMPDEVKPDGFEGLTILEAEKKLESLSDEDYEKVMKQFKESVEKSTVKETTIDGECDNAYIYKEDGAEAIHENMELVSSVTTEKNTPIIEYSWVDENGNVLDTLQVKKVCRQAVNRKGLRTKVYSGMKVIHVNHPGDPGRGDNPTPTPTPTPTPDKEWGKSGDPHSRPNRQPSDPVNPDSEVSKKQNDNTNSGNQGNSETSPGSSSNADNSERASGGTDQSGGGTAGTNSAPQGNPNADTSGNNTQKAAQETNQTGGDNHSDAEEENAVAEGNF